MVAGWPLVRALESTLHGKALVFVLLAASGIDSTFQDDDMVDAEIKL